MFVVKESSTTMQADKQLDTTNAHNKEVLQESSTSGIEINSWHENKCLEVLIDSVQSRNRAGQPNGCMTRLGLKA